MKREKYSTVFFTWNLDLSSELFFDFYISCISSFGKLTAPLCIKVHTGEEGNRNYLRPDYLKDFIHRIDPDEEKVEPTIVECNTAYEGSRNTTEKHLKLLDDHEWTKYFKCDILDSEGPDKVLPVKNYIRIDKNYVGKHIENYKSCIVISHFKAHPMGGFGGALKQLSIGFASSKGKEYIHGFGNFEAGKKSLQDVKSVNQNAFIESMADAASSIVNYFKNNIVFINILKNIAESCDCDSNAPLPCMDDIGILISADPVAIDQASINLIKKANDKGKDKIINRIESKNGEYILECAQKIGIGNRSYNLLEVE